MGLGEHSGEERAVEAARKAINSPLLEDVSIAGAKGVLINIAGDSNLTLYETNEVMALIHEATGSDAEIIFGTVIDDSLADNIRVTVIATGFSLNKDGEAEPAARAQEEPAQVAEPDTIGSPVLVGSVGHLLGGAHVSTQRPRYAAGTAGTSASGGWRFGHPHLPAPQNGRFLGRLPHAGDLAYFIA